MSDTKECDACGEKICRDDVKAMRDIRIQKRHFYSWKTWWQSIDICGLCFTGLKKVLDK